MVRLHILEDKIGSHNKLLQYLLEQLVGRNVTSSSILEYTADRPTTSEYAATRGARFDEVHVVVIDGEGKITGNAGTILEKHLSLSKASDAEFSAGSPSYWRNYLKTNSAYIFGGDEPAGVTTSGFYSSGFTLASGNSWDQAAEGVLFDSAGNTNKILAGGKDYDGNEDITSTGALTPGT